MTRAPLSRQVLEVLLDYGCRINVVENTSAAACAGWGAVHHAAAVGHVRILTWLLDIANADPEVRLANPRR